MTDYELIEEFYYNLSQDDFSAKLVFFIKNINTNIIIYTDYIILF